MLVTVVVASQTMTSTIPQSQQRQRRQMRHSLTAAKVGYPEQEMASPETKLRYFRLGLQPTWNSRRGKGYKGKKKFTHFTKGTYFFDQLLNLIHSVEISKISYHTYFAWNQFLGF